MKRHLVRGAALASMLAVGTGGIFVAKQYIADDEVRAQSPVVADSAATTDSDDDQAEPRQSFGGGRLLDELNSRTAAPVAAPQPLHPAEGAAPIMEAPESDASSPRDPFGVRVAAADLNPVAAVAEEAPQVHPLRDVSQTQPEPLEQEAPPELAGAASAGEQSADTEASPPSRYAELAERPTPPAEPANRYAAPLEQPLDAAPATLPNRDQSLREPRSFASELTSSYPASDLNPAATSSSPRPGAAELDGAQTPTLQVLKTAPAEIQVGKPAEFQIVVRNTGQVPAHDVVLRDHVPEGTRLMSAEPPAAEMGGGGLQWQAGMMAPGEERAFVMRLMPTAEGEIGSVASVSFRAEASVRTIATKPELLLEIAAPSQVMIDTPVALKIKVSNPGSGEATGVVLFEDVPPQLDHPAGKELEFEIGNLQPNESREIELSLDARQAGMVRNVIRVRGDASLEAQTEVQFEVVAPQLQVALTGPKRRYLQREAAYTLSVANPGTAPAKEIELVSHLPRGMQFVSANNSGQYDKATHSVYWSLAELPEGEQGAVEMVALAIEAGDQAIRVEGKAEQGLTAEFEENISVEGISALFFGVADVADPIEVGGDSSYEIHVVNQGTKSADAVRVVAHFPAGLKPIQADGPTRGVIQGNQVVFEPLARLAPKADTTFTIAFQGIAAGDQRVSVQLSSAEMDQPVTKEESTRVYSDR